jgi:hypothetical protein
LWEPEDFAQIHRWHQEPPRDRDPRPSRPELSSGRRELRTDTLLFVGVVNLDAQRLEKFQILIADLEFRIRTEGGDQGSLVGGALALFADADGGFENKKNIVAAFLDAGNNLGDLLGIGQRSVNRFSKFFHELLQLLIHESPRNRTPLTGGMTMIAMPPIAIVPSLAAKID